MSKLRALFNKITKLIYPSDTSKTAASNPLQFPIRQWRYALIKAIKNINAKNIPILAAGAAYFSTLSFFPLVIAIVAIATLAMGDGELKSALHAIEQYVPRDIGGVLSAQFENALNNKSGNITAGVIAFVFAIAGMTGATQNLISATNIAYDQKERRSFLRVTLISVGLTLGAMIGIVLLGIFLTLNRSILIHIGTPPLIAAAFPYLRWIFIIIGIVFSLATFYRYGPSRPNAKWHWVSWGATVATIIWLIGTIAFFLYVQYFGNFSNSYSLFAGLIILMIWFNLSSFIILLGAQINYHLEKQTTRRTVKQ